MIPRIGQNRPMEQQEDADGEGSAEPVPPSCCYCDRIVSEHQLITFLPCNHKFCRFCGFQCITKNKICYICSAEIHFPKAESQNETNVKNLFADNAQKCTKDIADLTISDPTGEGNRMMRSTPRRSVTFSPNTMKFSPVSAKSIAQSPFQRNNPSRKTFSFGRTLQRSSVRRSLGFLSRKNKANNAAALENTTDSNLPGEAKSEKKTKSHFFKRLFSSKMK